MAGLRRTFNFALAALLIGASVLVLTLGADAKDGFTQLDKAELDFGSFGSGSIIDWSNGQSQVRANIAPDDLDGSLDDGTDSTPEWSLEAYDTPCGAPRGALVYSEAFVNTNTYGPRINSFLEPHLLPRIASVLLVHSGPTETQHALDAGFSGRHELGCQNT